MTPTTLVSRLEVIVLAPQYLIDAVSERIERAYRLRRPHWRSHGSACRVATVAANSLLGACQDDPSIPLDPELFVAAQPLDSMFPDAWSELTGPSAIDTYRLRVREIVEVLRDELSGEVASAEAQIDSGQAIGRVLSSKSHRFSPLARYIVAQRAGRRALADRFLIDALDQHRSCPLYRQACTGLLDPEEYPSMKSTRSRADKVESAGPRLWSQLPLN